MKPGKAPALAASARKPRADGVESRCAILLAAANLATTRGLEGLSIGELARHIGMSKSGLYAHFKSKEELELAAIETAAEIFQREVIDRASDSPSGIARVMALTEAFLDHLARRVFPGGCFFATVAAQLAAHPGRPRDLVLQVQARWAGMIADALRRAIAGEEIASDTDVDQLVFEITAVMLRANFGWILSEDPGVLEQCRMGVRHALERVARVTGHGAKPKTRRSPRSTSPSRG
jgi:AcrR family transcriptional regulator